MVTTPSHEAQRVEAASREQAGIQPGETNAAALDVVADGAPQDPGPAVPPLAPQPAAEPAPRETPPAVSAFDRKRDAISARFRTERTADADADRDDVSDFARSGLPPEIAAPPPAPQAPQDDLQPPADDVDPAPEPAPAAPPRIKVKVHGKEQELPLEEIVAHAQKSLAAENILDEAKSKLKEFDGILEQARNKVARPDLPANTTPDTRTQGSDQPAATTEPPNQEDPYGKLIETIQFGDPSEARELLRNTIDTATTHTVQQELLQQRLRDEGARAAKTLKDFQDSHPDLAKDPMARAAIESKMFELQLADITALGLDPARIRPDGLPPTPGDIANAHRFYRANGFNVLTPQALLEQARDNFLEWKGVKTQTPDDPATPPRAAPRIDVTVDRTQRRAAIPQQPARTAAPRPDPQATPQPRDRSSIVNAEKARRAKLRGQAIGL
jgi:hypothetical protein